MAESTISRLTLLASKANNPFASFVSLRALCGENGPTLVT